MKYNSVPVLVLLTALAIGCGADDSAIGSCDTRSQGDTAVQGLCRTWYGTDTGDLGQLCTGQGGSFSSGDCSQDGLVGTCNTEQGLGLILLYHYYDNVFDVDSARAHCESRSSCTLSCVFDAV